MSEAPLPPFWEQKLDPVSGRYFYINHKDQSTQWQRPASSHERVGRRNNTPPTIGSWTCPICTLANKGGNRCAACNGARPAAAPSGSYGAQLPNVSGQPVVHVSPSPAKSGALPQSKPPQPKKSSKSWSCAMCTLENAPEAEKCVACDSARPSDASLEKEPSPEFVIFEDQSSGRKVDDARSEMSVFSELTDQSPVKQPTQVDIQEAIQEEGAEKPRGTPQPIAVEGSVSVSVEGTVQEGTVDVEQKSEPHIDFKPWTCANCNFTQNPQSFDKCMMCETPKPSVQSAEPNVVRQTSKKWDPVDLPKGDPVSAISESEITEEPVEMSAEVHATETEEFDFTKILEKTEEIVPESDQPKALIAEASQKHVDPAVFEEKLQARMEEFADQHELETAKKIQSIREQYELETAEKVKGIQEKHELETTAELQDIHERHEQELDKLRQQFESQLENMRKEKVDALSSVQTKCDAKLMEFKLKTDTERQELTQAHDRRIAEMQLVAKKTFEDYNQKKAEYEKSVAELDEMSTKLTGVSDKLANTEGSLAQANADLESKNALLAEIESQLKEVSDKFSAQEEELAKTLERICEVEKRAAARILTEVQKGKTLEEELKAANEKISSLESALNDAEAAVEAAKAEVENAKKAEDRPSKVKHAIQKPAPKASGSKWSCHVCTYENTTDATTCSMCQTARQVRDSGDSFEVFS